MHAQDRMPCQIWVLTLSAFAIGTAEFVIAGILPRVAKSLAVSDGQAGGLITAYALAIVFGGPILTLWLARFEKRRVLLTLMEGGHDTDFTYANHWAHQAWPREARSAFSLRLLVDITHIMLTSNQADPGQIASGIPG